ncbi:MAG: FAD:protein FMN transferase, partial [Deltaproteobacteria bacterium]|nr:FAD:protein FMN transferase [Deltaproteobacteria bacterium]
MLPKQKTIVSIFFVALLLFAGCNLKKEVILTGKTMGTNWRVKVVAGHFDNTEKLDKAIKKRLLEINQSMSLYDKESEICKLNEHRSLKKFHV